MCAGQPAVNVRINTVKGFALDLAAPEMAAKGASLIAADGAAILVDAIASRLLQGKSAYLSNLYGRAGGGPQPVDAARERRTRCG